MAPSPASTDEYALSHIGQREWQNFDGSHSPIEPHPSNAIAQSPTTNHEAAVQEVLNPTTPENADDVSSSAFDNFVLDDESLSSDEDLLPAYEVKPQQYLEIQRRNSFEGGTTSPNSGSPLSHNSLNQTRSLTIASEYKPKKRTNRKYLEASEAEEREALRRTPSRGSSDEDTEISQAKSKQDALERNNSLSARMEYKNRLEMERKIRRDEERRKEEQEAAEAAAITEAEADQALQSLNVTQSIENWGLGVAASNRSRDTRPRKRSPLRQSHTAAELLEIQRLAAESQEIPRATSQTSLSSKGSGIGQGFDWDAELSAMLDEYNQPTPPAGDTQASPDEVDDVLDNYFQTNDPTGHVEADEAEVEAYKWNESTFNADKDEREPVGIEEDLVGDPTELDDKHHPGDGPLTSYFDFETKKREVKEEIATSKKYGDYLKLLHNSLHQVQTASSSELSERLAATERFATEFNEEYPALTELVRESCSPARTKTFISQAESARKIAELQQLLTESLALNDDYFALIKRKNKRLSTMELQVRIAKEEQRDAQEKLSEAQARIKQLEQKLHEHNTNIELEDITSYLGRREERHSRTPSLDGLDLDRIFPRPPDPDTDVLAVEANSKASEIHHAEDESRVEGELEGVMNVLNRNDNWLTRMETFLGRYTAHKADFESLANQDSAYLDDSGAHDEQRNEQHTKETKTAQAQPEGDTLSEEPKHEPTAPAHSAPNADHKPAQEAIPIPISKAELENKDKSDSTSSATQPQEQTSVLEKKHNSDQHTLHPERKSPQLPPSDPSPSTATLTSDPTVEPESAIAPDPTSSTEAKKGERAAEGAVPWKNINLDYKDEMQLGDSNEDFDDEDEEDDKDGDGDGDASGGVGEWLRSLVGGIWGRVWPA